MCSRWDSRHVLQVWRYNYFNNVAGSMETADKGKSFTCCFCVRQGRKGLGDFIYFTEEQKERANAVLILKILQDQHEEVEKSGNEWRWKRHGSVTFRGNRWYRHSQQIGSHAIDFMQEFFGMSYPEAVTYLLDGQEKQLTALNDITIYHKLAACDIAKGQPIVKYGEHIGLAARDIKAGEHVHCHNLEEHRENLDSKG